MRFSLSFLFVVAAHAFAAVSAPPLPDHPAKPQPGLSLTFSSARGETDARSARLVALHLGENEAPTPFLAPGAFTARWEGDLLSALRAEYTISAEASAGFRLTINGAAILDDSNAAKGVLVKLNKGGNRLVAELPRAPKGDTFVRLKWQSRDFPLEPIPATAFSHDGASRELRAAARLREGRLLFAQLRCAACHDATAILPPRGQGMPELAQDAPVLEEIGAKYQKHWLAHWITDPHATRPHSLMPRVFASKPGEVAPEAADLAAYFAEANPMPEIKPIDEALIAEGGALFANLGCVACHAKPETEGADERGRVPLHHLKAKWNPAALESWLKNPAKNYQWNRMPHFRLSDEEAARLTAFLIGTATREYPAAPAGDATRGAPLLVAAGCLHCHAGIPPATAPKLEATLGRGWAAGCLAPDAGTRGKAPDFALTSSQREALQAFASAGFTSLKQDSAAEFAERQIANLRCMACHARDGEQNLWSQLDDETAPLQAAAPLEEAEGKPTFTNNPPPLTWLGEKLRTDYLAAFIAGHSSEKPRPWLVARMPGFAAPAGGLASGLAEQHGLPPADPVLTLDPTLVTAGETLLGESGGFNCTTCHGVGERPGTAIFEAPGINLALSQQRLRHDYYLRWVLHPQRIDAETKMPRFSDDEGRTPLTDILDGDATRQFEAIWHYIQRLKK